MFKFKELYQCHTIMRRVHYLKNIIGFVPLHHVCKALYSQCLDDSCKKYIQKWLQSKCKQTILSMIAEDNMTRSVSDGNMEDIPTPRTVNREGFIVNNSVYILYRQKLNVVSPSVTYLVCIQFCFMRTMQSTV